MRHWNKQTLQTIPEKPWKVEIIVGNCILYPAQAIKEVGFMDEKRLPQYGDAEYTPRMRKKGWNLLIEPRAKVYCKPNDVPQRYKEMPLKKLFYNIFINLHGPHSLRRRWFMILGSSPNKFEGYLAFIIFFIR